MSSTRTTSGVQVVCATIRATEKSFVEQTFNDHIVGAPAEESSVGWGGLVRFGLYLLMTVAVIHQARGEYAMKAIHELNAMFDRVWCPLPTWLHIVLVIAAWALCYRVGKDFVKTWKREAMTP